jgi:hypothetical protein
VGSIDDRLDLGLLGNMAAGGVTIDIYGRGHPDWTQSFDTLCKMVEANPGLNYLGEYDNDNIGTILSKYKIGILPYNVSSITRYVNPDKLYHYLNARLEVISTEI